jgi:hypothetical protein
MAAEQTVARTLLEQMRSSRESQASNPRPMKNVTPKKS